MEKRIEIAKNIDRQHNDAFNFLNSFFNDKRFKDIFSPLFNYNIRKLAQNFTSFYNDPNISIVKEFFSIGDNINKSSINSLTSSYKNGLRGVFYATIIKALLEKDNLKPALIYEAGEEIGIVDIDGTRYSIKINPARIILTIIHSFTNYTDEEKNKRIEFPGVGQIYDEFVKMFKEEKYVDVFFDALTQLFLLYEKNWCHLISFRNKQIYNNTAFDREKALLKEEIKRGGKNFNSLNEIKIQINQSAHIYLTKISVHYEFYSMRQKNNKPLFLLATDKNGCLNNIDSVWNIVEPCLSSLIYYLKITDIDDFEETKLCLNDHDEKSRKKSMAFRIIHTHLRYIDDFRKYVYFRNQHHNFANINKEIINRQKKYIDKLNELCDVRHGRYDDRKLEFEKNLKKQELDYNRYISLLSDNRNSSSDNL